MHIFSLSPTFAIDDIEDNLDSQSIVESPALSDILDSEVEMETNSKDKLINEPVGESKVENSNELTSEIGILNKEDSIVNKEEDLEADILVEHNPSINNIDDIKNYGSGTNNEVDDSSKENLSDDTTLKALGFLRENLTLVEEFDPLKKDYTAILSGTQTTIRFFPHTGCYTQVKDPNATMDIYFNDELVLNGITITPDVTFKLTKGILNVMKIIVTAENGNKETYTVTFKRDGSNDTTLKSLDFLYGNPELTEKFDANKRDYIALVKNNQTVVNLHHVSSCNIQVKDPYATMDIYFNGDLVLENITNTPITSLKLIKGETNIMKIVVKAENGEQGIYTVTFKRDGYRDTALKTLDFLFGNPELTEKFEADKKEYTALVKNNKNVVSLHSVSGHSIQVRDPYATMDIYLNNELVLEDITNTPIQNLTLVKGITNIMRIVVTSESGDQDTYTVTFKRDGYNDTALKTLDFLYGNPELTEEFNAGKKDYVAVVKNNQTVVKLHYASGHSIQVRDPYATMDIYFNDDLVLEDIASTPMKDLTLVKDAKNVMKIVVKAESGNEDIYTVTFEREGYNDTALKSLDFLYGNPELTEVFDANKKEYTALVKKNQNAVNLHYVSGHSIQVRDPYATMDIYFNGELVLNNITSTPIKTLPLVKGLTNFMNIVVTAQNGEQSTYTVEFKRELDSNTNIKELNITKSSLELKEDYYIATMSSWNDISLSKLILEDSWADYKIVLNKKKELTINEKFDLEIGDNKLDIEVTSNNGTKKTYPVIFERSDNVNPSVNCNVDNKDFTNEDVLINIESSDDSGIKYIELPNGETVYSNKAEFYVNQNGEYTFKVYDNFLNEAVEIVTVSNIDKEIPEIELKASTTELTNESVDILINASDNVDVKHIETPNGEFVSENTFKYTVREDGTYLFKVVDLAGNELVKSITLSNIDSVNPVLATELSNEDWSNEELTLSVFAMSNKGIKYIELPDGTKVEDNFAEYGISENGTYFIATESLGGNVTSEKVVVNNIDTELPTLILSPSTEDWTNEDVNVVINAEDNIGIDYIILPNGQKVHESNYSYPINTNGTYEFAAFDLAGNKTTEYIEIKNIDKNPPTIENYDDLVAVLNNIITLDLSTIETPSGIHKVILPNKEEVVEPDDNIIKYEVKYNDTYTFTVVDRAGNSVNVDVKIDTLIDREDSTNSNIPNDKGHMPDTSGINEIVVIISLISSMAGLMILKNRRR